jgi:hypothetical protein
MSEFTRTASRKEDDRRAFLPVPPPCLPFSAGAGFYSSNPDLALRFAVAFW